MKFNRKNLTFFISLFLFFPYSQQIHNDSLRAKFTYLLKSKPNNLYPNNIHEEFFSLQISDERAFFISEKTLEFDSVFLAESKSIIINSDNVVDFRGKSFPKITSDFLIIQDNNNIQYYKSVGMSLLSYKNPVINDWKLVNETKVINTLNCKKAELNYKGRHWIAWYSTEIQFPKGPYKFTGLPGLIIKISDTKGDYDFELVKSVKSSDLKDRIITIDKSRYENSKEVTKQILDKAKNNFMSNLHNSMGDLGVKLNTDQREVLRNSQKNDERERKGYNPLELTD
jgi:GLPGLI family protein